MEVQNTRKHNTQKIILEIEFKGLGFMCQGGPTGRISKTQALLATNKVSIPMRPKWVSDYPPPAQHGLACLQMLIKANDRRPRKNLNQRLISDGLASASHILHLYFTRLFNVFCTSGSTNYVFIYIVHQPCFHLYCTLFFIYCTPASTSHVLPGQFFLDSRPPQFLTGWQMPLFVFEILQISSLQNISMARWIDVIMTKWELNR